MINPEELLGTVRIASPCTASWDSMTGSDTVRYCDECKLNVYNISEMSADKAAALVEKSEGRLCVRLYRRTDGTVITKDCPVGLRAAVRRVTRAAGAVLAAAIGLFAGFATRTAWAGDPQGPQAPPLMGGVAPQKPPVLKMGKVAVIRRHDLAVGVVDESNRIVEGAAVVLTNLGTGEVVEASQTEDGGPYLFDILEPGVYTLTVQAEGFATSLPKTLRIKGHGPTTLTVRLKGEVEVRMGDVALPH